MSGIDFTDPYWGDAVSGVEPGWRPIVRELDQKLRAAAPEFEYAQLKEKYGGLRVYLRFPENMPAQIRDRARELVREAEEKASRKCENCGTTGRLREDRAWVRTLCDECDVEGEDAGRVADGNRGDRLRRRWPCVSPRAALSAICGPVFWQLRSVSCAMILTCRKPTNCI